MRILRHRPTPAMVVALIALFIALGGPAEAKKVINGQLLGKNTVTGRAVKNGSLAKADLSKTAIKSLERTPASSVRSGQIADGQVLAPDIGVGAVAGTALAAGSVTSSKLAADSIGGGSVANGSLQTLDIGSFAGAVSVDSFLPFSPTAPCQAFPAAATPAGGQPNIADDVIVVTPPSSWPETVVVSAKPGSGNTIRILACWINDGGSPPTPGPTVFRYVTFDSP
jgi:hypothetical protein